MNVYAAAGVIEEWMNARLEEGRDQFVSTPMLDDGGVLCAW